MKQFSLCAILKISINVFLPCRGVYVKNDGSLMREGDTLKDPLLANTLSRIAKDPMEFYQGGLAKEIIADIQEAGRYSRPPYPS